MIMMMKIMLKIKIIENIKKYWKNIYVNVYILNNNNYNKHQLSHGSGCNMANIFWVSHILPTYFTSLLANEIKAKYEKRGKYWPYCSR